MNNTTERTGRPRFTGVTTYQDQQGRFEFRHPWGWVRTDLDDDLDGVIVRPVAEDDDTYFAVWVSPLQVSVTADDLDDLRDGFDDGLAKLGTGLEIESADDRTYNNIVKLERTLSFTEETEAGPVRRKRRVWALYADTWQFLVAYQGSTVEEYHYWLPMGNYCFTAFKLPEALWFATDPEVFKSSSNQA